MDPKERRRCPRVNANRPARIRVANGPQTGTQLIDISEDGAALSYADPLIDGTDVELWFHLTVGTPVAFHVFGQVRHHYVRGESNVIGVQFTRFESGAVETIRAFVRQELRSD